MDIMLLAVKGDKGEDPFPASHSRESGLVVPLPSVALAVLPFVALLLSTLATRGKVERRPSNQSVSSTASAASSNIPFAWSLPFERHRPAKVSCI